MVEPSKPQNLGSIARVMLNFGYTNLVLVNPQVNLADPEIEIVARKAINLVHRAQIVPEFSAIREQHQLLIGTSARTGGDYKLSRVALPPDQLQLEEFYASKVAIVFGREQFGLSNAEIELCDVLLSIPTSPLYPVMNLSHAATIILYSLFKKQVEYISESQEHSTKHRLATHHERVTLENYFQKLLETTSYHMEKQHVALQAFSNILSRGYVTGREITTLMGVFKWFDINLREENS